MMSSNHQESTLHTISGEDKASHSQSSPLTCVVQIKVLTDTNTGEDEEKVGFGETGENAGEVGDSVGDEVVVVVLVVVVDGC